jgi:hypothetical protein
MLTQQSPRAFRGSFEARHAQRAHGGGNHRRSRWPCAARSPRRSDVLPRQSRSKQRGAQRGHCTHPAAVAHSGGTLGARSRIAPRADFEQRRTRAEERNRRQWRNNSYARGWTWCALAVSIADACGLSRRHVLRRRCRRSHAVRQAPRPRTSFGPRRSPTAARHVTRTV